MLFNCKNCLIECENKDKRSVFCSKKCSATWNNLHRNRKPKEDRYCINCNKILGNFSKKYCSWKCQHDNKRIKQVNSGIASDVSLKRYLLDIDSSCKICGLSTSWNNKPLVLILDHIDGNSSDSSLSNLRLVCPNCDSQLPTFKSRNRGNGRHVRKLRYHTQLNEISKCINVSTDNSE